MKTTLITALLIFANLCYSQTSEKSIHPKVDEYKVFVDQYKKSEPGNKEKQRELLVSMSNCSQEIICLLTKDQCTEAMPYFVENNMRERSCGSLEYPGEAVLNKLSLDEFKSCIKSLQKN